MNTLIIGLNFAPEVVGVGKYTGEMAAWLASCGHRVSIVTTRPYYPEKNKARAAWEWPWSREEWRGCSVIRCPLYVPDRWTGLRRLLHLASFAFSSLPAVIAKLFRARADVVAVIAPTLFVAPTALAFAKLTGAKAWIHYQDFEIEAAQSLGMVSSPKLIGLARAVERWLLRRFDLVSAISVPMVRAIESKGVSPERLMLLPNWTDMEKFFPMPNPVAHRDEYKISAERCVVLYSGNLGAKQGVEHVIGAAKILAADPSTSPMFVIAGAGSNAANLQRAASGLPNVLFLPLQTAEKFNEFLNMGDIQLLPQLSEVDNLVMPSKLGAMLAVGRPIIATTVPGTHLAKVIGDAGLLVPPGSSELLAAAIIELASNTGRREAMGQAARQVACSLGTPQEILLKLESKLLEVLASEKVPSNGRPS